MDSSAAYIIIKGGDQPSSTQAKRINYEQAFALNDKEAAEARSKGYLAQTCTGQDIHPASIPGVTLLNAEIPGAIEWRSSAIAGATNGNGEVGTYLDTLRPVFNASFYDGAPCKFTDAGWRTGSVDMVNQVRAKTSGHMVIANRVAMGSGRAYNKYQAAMDDFLARANPEGVQIEHFARSSKGIKYDQDFMKVLSGKGMMSFAK